MKQDFKLVLKVSFLVLALLVLSAPLYSQVSYKTLVISAKVGEVIDKSENEDYQLFYFGDDFSSARFLLGSDGKYYIRINMIDSSKSRTLMINENELIKYADKVELSNAIENGAYKPGFSEISVDSTAGKLHLRLKNPYYLDYYTKLPFAKNYEPSKKFRPIFGFGLGIKFLNMDLSEIKGIYDYVEQSVRDKGFTIPSNELDGGPNKFIAANFYLRIYDSFGLSMEAGKGVGSEWSTYFTSVQLKYHFGFKKIDWLKLYAGAGFSKAGFKYDQHYGVPVTSTNSGYYWRLDNIFTESYSKAYTLSVGTDMGSFDYKKKVYTTFFVDLSYSFFNEKEYTVSEVLEGNTWSKSGKTNIGSFIISSGVKIYL